MVCPQNAKEIVDETEKVRVLIQSGAPVYVSLAPSFIANYEGVGIEAMREALQQLGFADVEETAVGATIVKREYDRILNEEERDILISSCCHSVNLLIQKYFPQQLPYLADVLSPMKAHCQDIKQRHPEAKTVFIGPCVAKKDEAERDDDLVDAVLTFEELTAWLQEAQIELRQELTPKEERRARFFPTPGGILKTMAMDAPGYTYMAIDGVESCILAQYGRYVEQTVVPTKEGHMIIALMRDITAEEEERTRKEEISRKTVEVADKVVDKQMRIVQEIASLLGETAAETKVALTKLKESICDE